MSGLLPEDWLSRSAKSIAAMREDVVQFTDENTWHYAGVARCKQCGNFATYNTSVIGRRGVCSKCGNEVYVTREIGRYVKRGRWPWSPKEWETKLEEETMPLEGEANAPR